MENRSRSTGMFIRHFGLMPQEYLEAPQADKLLYQSLLNFHSLTYVGCLNIVWTPHLSQHLALDMPTRSLYLFQYPSICVLALYGGDYQELAHRLVFSWLPIFFGFS